MKCEERKFGSKSTYKMQFDGQGFKDQSIFYRLYRQLSNGEFVAIYESETSIKTEKGNHKFKITTLYSTSLIDDDVTHKVMLEIFQWYFFN